VGLSYQEEARAWRDWFLRAVAGSPSQIQILYGIAGEKQLPEREVEWLPGYETSRPVRVGNQAATQLQLDVYGEISDAIFEATRGGVATPQRAYDLRRTALRAASLSKLVAWIAVPIRVYWVKRKRSVVRSAATAKTTMRM
jgi:GH15 family glucan-1,4-alpha-glucosidase